SATRHTKSCSERACELTCHPRPYCLVGWKLTPDRLHCREKSLCQPGVGTLVPEEIDDGKIRLRRPGVRRTHRHPHQCWSTEDVVKRAVFGQIRRRIPIRRHL